MEDEFSRLYEIIISNPRIMNQLSRNKATLMGGKLDYLWGIADSDIYYVACMLKLADRYCIRTLVFADYLTYIPYGELGYTKFDCIVKDAGFYSVGEWRYKRFLKILGDNINSVSSDVLKKIEKFFEDYESDEVHLEDSSDIARAVCRIRHSFEALYKTTKYSEETIGDVLDYLTETLSKSRTISITNILATCPKSEDLNEKQLDFLKETVTKLTLPEKHNEGDDTL